MAESSLANLSEAETQLLCKFVRICVRADGEYSDAEKVAMSQLAAQVPNFWKALESTTEEALTLAATLEEAKIVSSTSVREEIYGALYELSIADGIDAGENELLDQLAATWDLEIKDVAPQ